jgi:hypothetical protein
MQRITAPRIGIFQKSITIQHCKSKSKAVPLHTMKALGGEEV